MLYAGAALAIAFFLIAFQWLRVVPTAVAAAAVARTALSSTMDPSLAEERKEALAREASVRLMGSFLSLCGRGALAVAVSAVPLFALQALGVVKVAAVVDFLESWQAIVGVSVLMTVGYFLLRPKRAAAVTEGARPTAVFETKYSSMDRWVHRLAFSGRAVQMTAADMESSMYGKVYRDIVPSRPVFVTCLPRAGTTLMLDVIHQSPLFATHCYRDMPFVLAPVLWNALSGGFHKRAELSERAHGDGMQVGYDSPEAFEEVLWRAFWPQKFLDDRIELWGRDEEAGEFREFFAEHMKKIIALRAPKGVEGVRYISKNNANVARVELLRRLFPDSTVLVPFRGPVAQAHSLLQQHQRFLEVHRQEAFSKRYMSDIGHLEFGELHRPIMFPGMDAVRSKYSPATLDYWVAYWVAAFEHLLSLRQELVFLSYERACEGRDPALAALSRHLDVPLATFQAVPPDVFRAPKLYGAKAQPEDAALARRADELHAECLKLSIL